MNFITRFDIDLVDIGLILLFVWVFIVPMLRFHEPPAQPAEPIRGSGLEGAEVRQVNGHEIEMVVKGRTFRLRKSEDGRLDIREKRRGRFIGRWLTGSPNAWKFGETQNQTITNYLKRIIENNEHIWGG